MSHTHSLIMVGTIKAGHCQIPTTNAEYTHLVYLTLMFYVFPRLYIDVVQFCSKFAGCSFAEKS